MMNQIYLGTLKDGELCHVLNGGYPVKFCHGEDVWEPRAWHSFDDGIFEPHPANIDLLDYPLVPVTTGDTFALLCLVPPALLDRVMGEDDYLEKILFVTAMSPKRLAKQLQECVNWMWDVSIELK